MIQGNDNLLKGAFIIGIMDAPFVCEKNLTMPSKSASHTLSA